ncbi:flavodoxin domain-containing protein [Nocardia sp. CDC153]|uniref:flavodoxin domain-containing protein n=1 Tax=Nocardia sp. CDC153 TaxID=3112167 RepID=UPI002DBC1131|nr:flavodoxin domain-containing protein [Nocardia sp. CDC153]MEC3952914.1 flavodoxin domain-containing protein [Nocardia sp. CDC153]
MTRDPVLVAYGSTRGGTAEIAEWIGESLRAAHIPADVRAAREVRSLDGFGAVVLGGALYTGRWHRDARRFARRFSRQLRERPVWVFASGPLDASTDDGSDGNAFGAKSVHKYAARLGALDTALFGGRLERTARGFPASAMAKKSAGDFRDRSRIEAWAKEISARVGQ